MFARPPARASSPGFRRHTTEVGAVAGERGRRRCRASTARRAAVAPRRRRAAAGLARQPDHAAPRSPTRCCASARPRRSPRPCAALIAAGDARRRDLRALPQAPVAAPRRRARSSARHVGHSRGRGRRCWPRRPEAQDLIALLDVLVSPRHDLSLARALRSPLFGASDDDLLALARAAADGASWWRALRELDAPSARAASARDAAAGAGRRSPRALPPHDLLDRIVAEGDVARALRGRGAARAARVRARRDRRRARAVALRSTAAATRRPTPSCARSRSGAREGGAAGARPTRAAAHRARREGPRGRHGVRDGRRSRAHQPGDDDAARRLAGRGRAAAALRLRLQREPLPAVAARRCSTTSCGAREREELNGLYVAMSRAQAAPRLQRDRAYRGADRPSWWSRVGARARPSPQRQAELLFDVPAPIAAPRGAARATSSIATLPPWRAPSLGAGAPRRRGADAASARLGRAVHRALEWIVGRRRRSIVDEAADAAAREFGAAAGAGARRLAAHRRPSRRRPLLPRPADPLGAATRCR